MFGFKGRYTNLKGDDNKDSSEKSYDYIQSNKNSRVWHVRYKPEDNKIIAHVNKIEMPGKITKFSVTNHAVEIPIKFLTLHSAAMVAVLTHKEYKDYQDNKVEIIPPSKITSNVQPKHPLDGLDQRLTHIRNKIWQAHTHPTMNDRESQNKLLELAQAQAHTMNVFKYHFGNHVDKDN